MSNPSNIRRSSLLYRYIISIKVPIQHAYSKLSSVHTKCLHADVSVNLHSLAYSLHICGYRWPLAKLFETVIRTAVAEHRTPVSESALPVEFYDLRISVLDVFPVLERWAENAATV